MNTIQMDQIKHTTSQRRIHPHKFTMWVAMASITMMFAGFTSAYIVKRNQGNWLEFELPIIFWYSTFVILASSLTMHLSLKSFKAREMQRYRVLITITAALGVLFTILQWQGFQQLKTAGIDLLGIRSNTAASFLFVITGMHILHVLGGVIALVVIFLRAYRTSVKQYSPVGLEIAATYWHFVDILWIYLFIFYSWIG